jgi:ribonucleoside-diphosphate reductase alpha chain
MSLKALSDYTVYARYAHYLKDKKRRETWEEIVERVFGMHARKFEKELKENAEFAQLFEFAKLQMLKKRVLGSQRALQFGGKWVEAHNAKIFNCTYSLIDRTTAFEEAMYLLLCGCGFGFSVQREHVALLPSLRRRNKGVKPFVVEDSIEGWSDAIGVCINSFFVSSHQKWADYLGYEIEFDFSKVRPEGSLIAGQFKAPGPKGLANSIAKIWQLLEKRLASGETILHPVDCYDVLMHCADAVLSGGVRRAATSCLFSKDDEEMMTAKVGNWDVENPQRARSNNSVVLLRDHVTWEDFENIIKNARHFGEPGFFFCEHIDHGSNPCQPAYATVLTKKGISTMGQIKEGDKIWSETGWTTVVKKWSNGVKPVFKYKTNAGVFIGTENHKVVSNGIKVEAKDAESIDWLKGPDDSRGEFDVACVMDGLVFGDGTVHHASNGLVLLNIGENDQDYFDSEISSLIIKHRPGINKVLFEVQTSITANELPQTFAREIPQRFVHGSPQTVCSFLRGLFSANGSIVNNRVTLKASSFKVIEAVQQMLSSVGIASYYTKNKSKSVDFKNGTYISKKSYDLNITSDKKVFTQKIGFLQGYKQKKLEACGSSSPKKASFEIYEIESLGEDEVFDITVDNEPHTYWTGGCNVSNCFEIGLYPKTRKGVSGVQGCNLCEINGRWCDTEEKFLQACEAAAIIGTLQAKYTDFVYLSPESKEIFDEEALLGVSITGIMDCPEILLNEGVLAKGAKVVNATNRKVAAMIGINPAARTTCIKPAGSTSCVLQTASGIHPHHARRYIRRAQSNKQEWPANFFKSVNPEAVEESVWSSNNTDYILSFMCEVPAGAVLKNDLSAIEMLKNVLKTQQSWVTGGHNEELCVSKGISHNVSNTIHVKPNEWHEVAEFIYQHRESFTAISLISAFGDLDYTQAPFSQVLTPSEMVKEYGDASVLASGLVVDGLAAFDGDLWEACKTALGFGKPLAEKMECPEYPVKNGHSDKVWGRELVKYFSARESFDDWFYKVDWVRRAKQFANRYFNGDLRTATYCLKHAHVWHKWLELKRTYKEIDWSEVSEPEPHYQQVDETGAQACAGGACVLGYV